ncbi:MAG: apolipoprotein N-acyltransferase [Verrucomicrobiota bacterium]
MGKLRRLNNTRVKELGRYALAVVVGLLWAAAYPKLGLAGAAWLVPASLLLLGAGQTRKRAFRLGYVAGLAFNLAALYWLWFIPVTFFPILGWLALSAYLALYPALWVWLGWRLFPGGKDGQTKVQWDAGGWAPRVIWAFSCALLWVALEMIMGRLLSGFPWLFLGTSQYRLTPLIQVASLTGVYGVSFLMVWASVSLFCAGGVIMSRPTRYWTWLGELALPAMAVGATLLFGMKELLPAKEPDQRMKIALIQPSIPQKVKWDPVENRKMFQRVLDLSRAALVLKPDVVMWPEAATPGLLRYEPEVSGLVTNFAELHNVWIVLGADDAEPRAGSSNPEDADYFNSSFLVDPKGRLVAKYDKRKLVAFGEFIPFEKWVPIFKFFTPIPGGFTPGGKPEAFQIEKPRANLSVLICFEDVFPHVAREYVREDTDFLINLTNNGWFGEGAAHWQHAASSALRAVENRVPLVRCTNNGLTCWIDGHGRLRDVFGEGDDIYGAGFKIIDVPLLDEGQRRALTFYTRHGDVFGWICVVMSAVLVGYLFVGRKQAQASS